VIKINKGDCPPLLATEGAPKTKSLCEQFDKDRSAYLSGKKKFDFDNRVYGLKEVREALLTAQHGKCCYSETRLVIDYPHVEHFRPKGGFQTQKGAALFYPGYYWLAYDWSNLLLSKPVPNSSFKKNLFPLVDETKRNRNHDDNHAEEALLIHPGEEDPRDHIRFAGAMVYAYQDSDRGKSTIELLGLDSRNDLKSDREERLEILKVMSSTIRCLHAEKNDNSSVLRGLVDSLKEACEPHSIYSSMATDFVLNDGLKSILGHPQPPAASPAQPGSPPSDQP
jgi:uncharacterized protein (TIGR02646 family)